MKQCSVGLDDEVLHCCKFARDRTHKPLKQSVRPLEIEGVGNDLSLIRPSDAVTNRADVFVQLAAALRTSINLGRSRSDQHSEQSGQRIDQLPIGFTRAQLCLKVGKFDPATAKRDIARKGCKSRLQTSLLLTKRVQVLLDVGNRCAIGNRRLALALQDRQILFAARDLTGPRQCQPEQRGSFIIAFGKLPGKHCLGLRHPRSLSRLGCGEHRLGRVRIAALGKNCEIRAEQPSKGHSAVGYEIFRGDNFREQRGCPGLVAKPGKQGRLARPSRKQGRRLRIRVRDLRNRTVKARDRSRAVATGF